MKKKIKISTAIPASMSGFQEVENSHLTTATLRVFHSGLTGDGRLFTKKFAAKIAATIGGTPVVAKYDEENDDFEGHANSQSVFGFVPEKPIIRTEIDSDGNSWLFTEVKLFTERHDVGSIARKIVGRAQSLELDPDSIDVKFMYDEEGEFDKIEFHDGNLIGLSVLGYNQAPAFKGSGFFTETIQADKIEELIAKYNNIPTSIVMETGGKSMKDFENVDDQNVAKDDIKQAITQEPQYDPVLEPTVEEEILEDPVVEEEVPEVLAVEPEAETSNEEDAAEPIVQDEPVIEDPVDEPEAVVEEPVVEEPEAVTPEDEGEGDAFESETEAESSTEEIGVEPQAEEIPTDTPTFSDADREELESYRRADKIGIIGSYAEYLSEDELKEFETNVDAFSKEELDRELSFKAMQLLRNKTENKPTFAFNVPTKNTNKASDPIADAIKNYRGEQ